MLRTFRGVAGAVEEHLKSDRLDRRSLTRSLPEAMSPLNRLFHECLFERILTFTSDDFRQLVEELGRCPDEDVNRLIFADFDFAGHRATPLLASLLRHPRSLMARTMAAAFAQQLRRWRLR